MIRKVANYCGVGGNRPWGDEFMPTARIRDEEQIAAVYATLWLNDEVWWQTLTSTC